MIKNKSEGNIDPQPDFGQVVDTLLKRLPVEQVQAIRLGAIPHRFNTELLSVLSGATTDTDTLLEIMHRLGFLVETRSGWFAYHDHLRNHLLVYMQGQLVVYRRANARAAEYFHDRLAQKSNPDQDSDLLEYLYHQLASDETIGLLELRRYFNNFRQTNQSGLIRQLIDYANEQRPVLSQAGQDWLRYLDAQLNQAGPELDVIRYFQELATTASDPFLRAAARRSLGEALIFRQQWVASVKELQTALSAFQDLGIPLEVASTQTLLGTVFVSLAEASGGLRDETPSMESRKEKWLYYLQHAPFLVYRWFSRRCNLVPNLYFGDDYQNWIIVRYMYSAIRWFQRADRTLDRGDEHDKDARSIARAHVRIRLADLSQRIGRWSQAERRFEELEQNPVIRTSPYLQALVQLGRGNALLMRGKLSPAIELLRESQKIFQQYRDLENVAQTGRLIGHVYVRLGEIKEATEFYQEALEDFYRTNDLLNATETLGIVQSLIEQFPGDDGDDIYADDLSKQFPRQAYMGRFPGLFHRFFRGFATFLVLPLTYLLVLILAFTQTLWTGMAEMLVVTIFRDAATRLALLVDLATALPFLFLLPLLAVWTYQAIYAIVGALVSRVLPAYLLTLHQPIYFIIDQQSLQYYDQEGKSIDYLQWSEAICTASLDRCIWRYPLTLFSRFLVSNGEKTIIADGIINRYSQFKHQVIEHLSTQPKPVRQYLFNFSLLDKRWFSAALATTFLLVLISFFIKLLDPKQGFLLVRTPSSEIVTLYVTDLAFQFWRRLVIIGPLFSLIHLLHNRRAIRQTLGDHIQLGAEWPIWLALLMMLIMTLGELWQLFS